MALPSSYTAAAGAINSFFEKIRDGQAPEKFTNIILRDLGFKSNNHRVFIPILKPIGFLSGDGAPTQRYHEYRSHAQSKSVMGQALKEAYSDLFLITANPGAKDKDLITGKFKSYHNVSDLVAKQMTNTFYALLKLADLNNTNSTITAAPEQSKKEETASKEQKRPADVQKEISSLGLHYNIQIHLPATKDIEVYNAIFKSIKDHLIEQKEKGYKRFPLQRIDV